MQAIYRTLARISQSDLPVLVSGPAGSGKKVLARTIHEHSKRKAASFVTVNISALGQDFARELFGTVETPGRLARAGAGTLALNDIADMPRAMQTALEDLVERGEYRPVNSKRSEQLAARIISVTGYDAAGLLEREKIRPELFYRLGVVSIAMPALAERLEDIPELAQNLLARMVQEGAPRCRILPEAIAALQAYDWPGNVRELDNVLRNLCVLATDRIIDAPLVRQVVGGSGQSSIKARHAAALSGSVAEHLETYFRTHQDSLPPAGLYDRILAEVEKPLIEKCLAVCNGNQIRAADLLGLNRNTLRKKIRELGIAVSRGESRVT
jgi:two-component system nitrogen regulation response regulator GlnG